MRNMGGVTLEVPYPKNVDGIAADPQPDWSFDALLLELNSLEDRLNASTRRSLLLSKTRAREVSTSNRKRTGAFVMQVLDGESVTDSDSEEDRHHNDRAMVVGRRFVCDELPLSNIEDSDDESAFGIQSNLMDTVGFVEGALSELTHDHQLTVMEEMRSQIIELETDMMNENEKFSSMLTGIEKYTEAKREMDRKLDMQYQRRIAEALDNHLTAVQRDHEHKSQIEERRIRDDAVREEAQRREKAIHEEKLRQEKIRVEAEVQARLEAEKAEAARVAALEAERRAAEEAAKKAASEDTKNVAPGSTENSNEAIKLLKASVSQQPTSMQSAGNLIRSTENALKLEERRLLTYKEVTAQNSALGLSSDVPPHYRRHGQTIARNIRQITGSKDNVRAKAGELMRLISDPSYPQSISIVMFVEKFVSLCDNLTASFNRSLYAYGRIIVLVTSKVPLAMDIFLAELNRVCIYTVPKHIRYSKSTFETKEAYYKAIGYRDEGGEIESTDAYVDRLGSYMKLYGALVQTEVDGIQNLHGIAEGWAWLARFLNALPPNLYTAVALQSFLEMAGFALHRRYRTQFKKIVRTIVRDFLSKLIEREDPKLNKAVVNIRNYIESNQFLKEPEGRQLESYIESNQFLKDTPLGF